MACFCLIQTKQEAQNEEPEIWFWRPKEEIKVEHVRQRQPSHIFCLAECNEATGSGKTQQSE